MNAVRLTVSLAVLLLSAGAHAQLYKWVGPDGKVNYTDTPPPPAAKNVEKRTVRGEAANDGGLPFELAQAVNAQPVTLYTTSACPPCDDARKLLNSRGVPFTEKTVSSPEDIAKLREAGGAGQLPLLVVGASTQQGWEPGLYGNLLSAAGYPETNKLPRGYRQAAATPAAPAPRTASAAAAQGGNGNGNAAAPRSSADALPPPVGNVPPGFRF